MAYSREPMSQASFSRLWRTSAQSMNVDSQDTDSQVPQPLASQFSQTEDLYMSEPEIEVPTSSKVSMPENAALPSTPRAKRKDADGDEDMVMETPTGNEGQGSSPPAVNRAPRSLQNSSKGGQPPGANPSYEETVQELDGPPDSSQAVPSMSQNPVAEDPQATAGDEQVNGKQTNGTKKERPAFNPYDTATIIPRSPLEIGLDEQRLHVLHGSTEDAASFEFLHEDHTFGNALRHAIMKKYVDPVNSCPVAGSGLRQTPSAFIDTMNSPAVELAGYTIPHPSESKMHIRIQMYDGASAYDALEKGIDDLDDMCDAILEKFEAAKEEFMDVEEHT
ncbi:MAG: RNA polymerase subunit AC19 [Bathelium mastoideum]|nr:MAG: RNA polymerase subunit AC19 [Bathelium mastoideum]